jgi:AcrR family transcriptional regulator
VPQEARSRATIDAILDAAAHILGERGWAGLTTNAVAEVAGISIGSLYQYSPNKLAMIEAAHRRHFDQVLAVLRAAADE